MNAKVSKNRGKIRKEQYVFKLYISGIRPAGERAYSNLKLLCEEYLKGHYKISIVNIRQEPRYIIKEQLLIAPTVIKKYPLPEVRMAGDLSDINKVLMSLNIQNKGSIKHESYYKQQKK